MPRRLHGAPLRALLALTLVVPAFVIGPVEAGAAPPAETAPAAPGAAPLPPPNVWGFDTGTIVAGTGTAAYSGDGGPASAAELRQPGDVAVSPDGTTWYVADTWNNRVRAIDVATGVITTVAGNGSQCSRATDPDAPCGDGGQAAAATLNRPGGLALKPDGSVLYIADTDANLVRAVTLSTGVITTFAGTVPGGTTGGGTAVGTPLSGPAGVLATADGDVYIADTFANRVWVVGTGGTIQPFAGTGTPCTVTSSPCGDGAAATSAQLSAPMGVSGPDPDGAIVVADTGDNRVRLVASDGTITTVAGTGVGGNSGDTGLAVDAQLDQPARAVVGPAGVIWIVDSANNRVRVAFETAGTIWAVAGTGTAANGPSGQPSWATTMNGPTGLALTADGQGVVVTDTANQEVRAFTGQHARLSFTACGPNGATLKGRYSAEIPLSGLPAGTYVSADVNGGAGGQSTESSGGTGGYAHQTWQVDQASTRLFAAVGCQGDSGNDDEIQPAAPGSGGGASAVAALDGSTERVLVIAGGGGGAASSYGTCQASGLAGWPGGNGAQAAGTGPTAAASGHGGQGGQAAGASGTNGQGGPGGTAYGGWGLSFTGGAGAGGPGAAVQVPGNGATQSCAATGSGGGGYGGGAGGFSVNAMGGSSGGNYGQCVDGTVTEEPSGGAGSIVVEIKGTGSASCTLSTSSVVGRKAAAQATRDKAAARAWAAVDAISAAQARQRQLPTATGARVAAASTVAAAPCPTATPGADQQPGNGQAVFYEGNSANGSSLLVDTGAWDEAACRVLADYGGFGYVAVGPGVVVRTGGGGGTVVEAATSGPVTMSGPFTSGAVLEAPDYLKLFNQCQGCDLTDVALSGLTFPPHTDLTGAILSGVTIYNTELSQAILTNTTFGVDSDSDPAVISDSSFQGAHVEGTVFDQTVFRAAGFEQATLTCASFVDAVLIGASFADAMWTSPSCSRPTFDGSVLTMETVLPPAWAGVTFSSASIIVDTATRSLSRGVTLPAWTFVDSQFLGLPPDLSHMTVTNATLDGSSLVLADLTGTTFAGTTSMASTVFTDAILNGTTLTGAKAHGAVFTGADLEGATFDTAQLGSGTDPANQLPTATFTSADAHGASFRGVQAQGVDFDGAYLYPGDSVVSFDGADLSGATFEGAVLGRTDFTDVTAGGIGGALRLDGAQCIDCVFAGAHLDGAHFDSAYLYGASFAGAVLNNASFVNAACCATGTWTFVLGAGASATAEPYTLDSRAPTLNSAEFDDVTHCPNGREPVAGSGCNGRTVPQAPPNPVECMAAADHDCGLDIDLLAGNGQPAYSSGGPTQDAVLAAFHSPGAVAYDASTGNVIVADTANGVVRRVGPVSSTTPLVSVLAGTPPAAGRPAGPPKAAPPRRTRPRPGEVRLVPSVVGPTGVATTTVDGATIVGIADKTSNIVFTTTGADPPSPLAGTGTACPAPTDSCGDGGPATRAQLNSPEGLWYDLNGNLYLADTGDNRARRVDTDGQITTVAGTGQPGAGGDGGTAPSAELSGPTGIAGDQLGNLYVADAGNHAIRRIDPTGTITTLAGGAGGTLTKPTSVTVDGRNRILLTDAGANVVDSLNLFGVAHAIAGTGAAGYSGDGGAALAAQLNGPTALIALGDDLLVVADTGNDRIRVLQAPRGQALATSP